MRRKRRGGRGGFLFASFSVIFLALFALQAVALEYIVGADDVLQVSFWQQPDLNTVTRIRQDGKISLPVVGEIQAAGLTAGELEESIVRGISIYNKEISQARVEIVEYNSRRIFITGEVYRPGKYSFEEIPNLWEVIREAGGPRDRALLSDISVIRAVEGGEGEKITVNLAQALDTGNFSRLPPLKPGDTVIVPAAGAEGSGGASELLGRSVVYVYGQIARPGVYNIDEGSTLLQVITQAGGVTVEADMKNVRVLIRQGTGSSVAKVNLDRHMKSGSPPDFPLHSGDTVVVMQKSGLWRGIWKGFTTVVGISSGVVSIIYLLDWLSS